MKTKPAFRSMAASCLARAKSELASNSDRRLRYAALELRMAIEGVTYDRAYAYEGDFPASSWGQWQPKKFMDALLQLNPNAASSISLKAVIELADGSPDMSSAPSYAFESVLSMAEIKKNYNALGSFLHLQTRDKYENGDVASNQQIRARCEEIVEILDRVFASSMWNVRTGVVLEFDCQRCDERMVRTAPWSLASLTVCCFKCEAEYELTPGGENSTKIRPLSGDLECPWEDCGAKLIVWRSDLKAGSRWRCSSCQRRMRIGMGVGKFPEDVEDQKPGSESLGPETGARVERPGFRRHST